jgi:hypothetical protein
MIVMRIATTPSLNASSRPRRTAPFRWADDTTAQAWRCCSTGEKEKWAPEEPFVWDELALIDAA